MLADCLKVLQGPAYKAVAHIEMDHYACDTLRTREAFHYLKDHGRLDIYEEYLKQRKKVKTEKIYGIRFLKRLLIL